jgi:hypothetical protein
MGVTQEQIQVLKNEGFSEHDINEAVRELESEELGRSYSQTQMPDPRMLSQPSVFSSSPQDNLIKWQLELDNILERAEHILRGDKLEFREGHMIWIKSPEGHRDRILNEYGVQEVMKVLSMYLNRNTILADYDDEEINDKVFDFGMELKDLFFMKYEEIGLTDLDKRKNYPMLIREIVDMIHSAYKRALHGGERRSLREARSITQSEALMPAGININTGQPLKERGILNPMRYILGKQA